MVSTLSKPHQRVEFRSYGVAYVFALDECIGAIPGMTEIDRIALQRNMIAAYCSTPAGYRRVGATSRGAMIVQAR